MKRTIKNPHWTNNARTILSAEFHYEDGRVTTATISDTDVGNPDLKEILETFTTEELEKNTQNVIRKIQGERERQAILEETKAERKKQEDLFAVKMKSFEIEAIKNSTNRSLKSKIRRAKSDLEVMAYTVALILEEDKNPSVVTTQETIDTQTA